VTFTRARTRIVKPRPEKKSRADAVPPSYGLDCPTAEDLAAYIDKRIPGHREVAIDEHLCKCAACMEVYVAVLRFLLAQKDLADTG